MIKYGLDTEKTYKNKSGSNFKVTEFISALKVKVVFNSGYSNYFYASNIRKGSIVDKLSASVYGVGINDADYPISSTKNGVKVICPFYTKWHSMLYRCYSKSSKIKNPTYSKTTVCKEWHLFSEFKKWMETQDWKDKDLDKDILKVDNKVYCPEFCCFVSHHVNSLLLDCGRARGKLPLGVTKNWNKFEAKCSYNDGNKNKTVYLGLHDTPELAHSAYIDFKVSIIKDFADKENERIKNGLIRHAEKLIQSKKV